MIEKQDLISNRYKILNKIATGGMADVFTAHDTKLDRKVAIKILHETSASNKNLVTKFKREAHILAKLDHPNIVSVYDWGKYRDSYYICMEYVKGITLEDLIQKKGPLDNKKTAVYALQICRALETAHKNSLIHRDIKPQNILITSDDTIKVTDFGIAKSLIDDATKTLNILGTANYVSPEQAKGELLDSRTDIYSLGILMYEMVTSDTPFRGESTIDITLKHINEKPVSPSKLVEDLPRSFERIILKCMEKERGDRYQSVASLKTDLLNFLEGRKVTASSTSRKTKEQNIIGNKTETWVKTVLFSLIGLFIISTVIFLTLFLSYFYRYRNISEDLYQVKVPPLESVEVSSAEKILSTYGLDIDVTQIIESSTSPFGIILEQSPPAGTVVLRDSKIEVIIAEHIPEEKTLEMPYLLGVDIEQADEVLSELGIESIEFVEKNDDSPEGNIIRQEPVSGTLISPDAEVTLTVSLGEEDLTIPNVIGWDYYLAINQLNEMGFNINHKRVTDASVLPGTIVDVLPAIGSEVEKGSTITLFISTTDELVAVPDLVYLDLSEAITTLEGMQMGYEINYVQSDYSFQENTVIAQIPETGSQIDRNTSIILFVGD